MLLPTRRLHLSTESVSLLKQAEKALAMLLIDNLGLNEIDIKLLSVMIDFYQGGPVGMKTLAMAVGEDVRTLEDMYEPYLMQQGFLQRTPRGRIVTRYGWTYFHRSPEGKAAEQISLEQEGDCVGKTEH